MTGNIQKGISAIIDSDKKYVPILERTIMQNVGTKSGSKSVASLAKIDINMESRVGSKTAAKLGDKIGDIKIARKSKKSKPKTKKGKTKDCGCDA